MKKSKLRSLAIFSLIMIAYFAFALFIRESNNTIKFIFYFVAILWLVIELTRKKQFGFMFYSFVFSMLYIMTIMGFSEIYGWKGFWGCMVLFPAIFFSLVYLLRFLFFHAFRIKSETKNSE